MNVIGGMEVKKEGAEGKRTVALRAGATISVGETVERLLQADQRIGWPLEYVSLRKNLHGWFRPGNREVLNFLIKPHHKIILELGSWLGVSTTNTLQKAPNALVFAVDIWSNEYFLSDSHYDKEQRQSAPIYEQFLHNTEEFKLSKNEVTGEYRGLLPMKMDTTEALLILQQLRIQPDLIYIDASHHYDYVVKDVTNCLNFFPDAIIVGDDWDNLDVRRAVKDVAAAKHQEIFINGGTCWTFENKEIMDEMVRMKRRAETEEGEQRKRRKTITGSSFSALLGSYGKN